MGEEGSLEDFVYDDLISYSTFAEKVVADFVDKHASIPELLENVLSTYQATGRFTAVELNELIESSDPRDLFMKWLGKKTATSASARKFLREELMHIDGNPFLILSEVGFDDGLIPALLDLDTKPIYKEEQSHKSTAVILFSVSVMIHFLLARLMGLEVDEGVDGDDNASMRSTGYARSPHSALVSRKSQKVGAKTMVPFPRENSVEEELRKDNALLRKQVEELSRLVGLSTDYAKGAIASVEAVGKPNHELKNNNWFGDDSLSELACSNDENEELLSVKSAKGAATRPSERKLLLDTIITATQFTGVGCMAKAPNDLIYLNSQIESEMGLPVITARGDIYSVKKCKAKESSPNMFKLSLISPNYKSSTSLSFGGFIPQYFLPSNYPQFIAHIEEQQRMLEADDRDEVVRNAAKEKGKFCIQTRINNIQYYFRQFNVLLRSKGMEKSEICTHPFHVQVWSLFAQFHYLLFSHAIASNQDKLLRKVLTIWNDTFEIKLQIISLHVHIKDAAFFLGYGCGKCRRGGMLDSYCLNCNGENVAALMGRAKMSDDSESFDIRYEKWVKEKNQQGVTDTSKLTKKLFKAEKPRPPQTKYSKISSVVTLDEYFTFLSEHQKLYHIVMPPAFLLN